MKLYSEQRESIPSSLKEGDPGFYYIQKLMSTAYDCTRKRGGSEDASLTYKEMLSANPNFKTDSVMVRSLHIPVSPWPEKMSDHDFRICELMRRNLIKLAEAYKPMLLSEGIAQEVVDKWVRKSEQELNTLRARLYTRWTYAWVLRKDTPWQATVTP
ncbi:hypothetical protein FRB99_000433 [Tulasnella sp. 403]|nr:hypothetical protein FRB99_000433 [Tulasnella sp. 403]